MGPIVKYETGRFLAQVYMFERALGDAAPLFTEFHFEGNRVGVSTLDGRTVYLDVTADRFELARILGDVDLSATELSEQDFPALRRVAPRDMWVEVHYDLASTSDSMDDFAPGLDLRALLYDGDSSFVRIVVSRGDVWGEWNADLSAPDNESALSVNVAILFETKDPNMTFWTDARLDH